MDLISNHPFWPRRDGLIHSYAAIEGDASCDVAIIGGGITGALVAYHLARAGLDVVVLDKRDVGGGSTSASTALLQYEIDIPLVELADMRGEDIATHAYRACAGAVERLGDIAATLGDDIEFERKTSLYLAGSRRDVPLLERELAARRAIGLDVDWIGAEELTTRFGIARDGAIYSRTAAQVDPFAFAHALLADAVARGARVYDRTTVTDIDVSGERCTLRTDRDAVVDARRIVFATGYETRDYIGGKVARLASTYAVASEPGSVPAPWFDEASLVWEHARPYLYMRTTPDGRVIVGGEDEDFRDPERRDALIAKKTARLQSRYADLVPGATLDVAYAWAGTFGETKDGLAYIGAHPDWPNADFALGYGGNGITFALLSAEIIRDGLLGHSNENAALFRFGR